MNFNPCELHLLALHGIDRLRDLGNGSVKCSTPQGERYYTASDLKQLAKPGFFDRFTALMGVRHA